MNSKEAAKYIDYAYLKAEAQREDIKRICDESVKYQFALVAINQMQTEFCAQYLKGTDIKVGAAIGFPLGQTTIESKVFETEDAINKGASEIDYVINIGRLKDGDLEYIEKEMTQIVKIAHKNNCLCKAIIEICYLDDKEIEQVCTIANKVKPDFVKSSTGFGTSGAKVDKIRLMRSLCDPEIGIKAAGGIRDIDSFKAMIDAGATRIGTGSAVEIMKALEEESCLV